MGVRTAGHVRSHVIELKKHFQANSVVCSHVSFLSSKQPQSSRPDIITVNAEYNVSQFPPTVYQLKSV